MLSRYIALNKLYKKNKQQAISNIKSEILDMKLSLQTLSTDFLKDIGLWNNNIKNQIALYNTKKYYTNYRILDIKYRLLDFISNKNDPDYLLTLDYNMSNNTNYYLLDLTKFIKLLSSHRKFNLDYIKLIKDIDKNLLYELIYKNTNLYKYIMKTDPKIITDKEVTIKLLGSDVNDIALNNLDYKELYQYRKFITDDYIKNNITRFKLSDLFTIKNHKFIWECIKLKNYKIRYKMYSSLSVNEKVVNIVRQDIKNLVKNNYKQISAKFKVHVNDTLSIIKEIVDQIINFPVLTELAYLVISELEDISKDICMFYILNFISKIDNFTNNESFTKKYVNTVRLLKLIYKDVDIEGLQDLIDLYIINKKYSSILLLELTNTCKYLKDINEVYLYEDYNIKLKDEIFERYQKIKGINTPNKCNIKYLTILEVNKIETDKFIYEYYEDYIFIRNVARLITNNLEKIKDFEKINTFFFKCSKSDQEDIKLIGNSMISKIEVFNRNK